MLTVLFLLVGCASKPTVRHYRLTPRPDTRPVHNTTEAIGIGSVIVPTILTRKNVVTALGREEIELHHFHRWTESLPRNIARVAVAEISGVTGLRTEQRPYPPGSGVTREVVVEIEELLGQPGYPVFLKAKWRVFDNDQKKVVFFGGTELREDTGDISISAYIRAINRIIQRLGREIGENIP